LSFNN
jgi:hypothetical protein